MYEYREWILEAPLELCFKNESFRGEVSDTEVIADTIYSAVSMGTELAAFKGMPPLRPVTRPYPRKVGYCNVARITHIGSDVTDYNEGDIIYTHASHCSRFHLDQENIICRIPEALCSPEASTCYLYHLGYSALLNCDVPAGSRVIFIGSGNLSLHANQVFQASGILVDIVTGYPAEGISANFITRDNTTSNHYDAAIVFTNSWDDYNLALKVAGYQGKVVLVGFPGREDPIPNFNPLSSQYVYDKQLTIKACGKPNVGDKERSLLKNRCQSIIMNIGSNVFNAGALIDSVVPYSNLPEVYSNLSSGTSRIGTVVLDWSN